MNKNEIIRILDDWNFWKNTPETGIIRSAYLDLLKDLAKTGQVVSITGPRRSGKSFIMRQFAKLLIDQGLSNKNILFINFEDPRLPELTAKSLDQIFNIYLEFLAPQGEIYVFLDEIQEVVEWEKWVTTIQELGKARLIISGSNAKLLSRELATVLTGRHIDLTVFPLSFKEYLKFNNVSAGSEMDIVHNAITLKGMLRKYLESGAYPAVVLSERKEEILLSYFEDILNKDLLKRYKIRKGEKLKSLAKFYLNQAASLSTYNSAARFLGLTADTVEKFSSYLESAYLVFSLKRFSFKIKEQEKSPRKIYIVDTGLANAIGFTFSSNWGRAAENAVFLELERRRSLNPSLELYYWKDVHHREVDFVIKQNKKVNNLIQVAWETGQAKTKDREMRSLLKAMDEFTLLESDVLTEDEEFEENVSGKRISFIPLWKWLLS